MTSASVRHGNRGRYRRPRQARSTPRGGQLRLQRDSTNHFRLTHVLPGQPESGGGTNVTTDEEMFDHHLRVEGAKLLDEAEGRHPR